MPYGNGTGRMGGFGRGMGRFRGNAGNCICPKCGKKVPHQRGIPCSTMKCPDCGTIMCRE